MISDLESGRGISLKEWALKDLDNALSYFQDLKWTPQTGSYLSDMKALSSTIRDVNKNMTSILDGFMKHKKLQAFLVVHSVFNVDARTDGEFIETYMLSRIHVSDDQIKRLFSKKIPDKIQKLLGPFEISTIPFSVERYRVEFGCRKNPITGKYERDPIRLIDTTLDVDTEHVNTAEFIDQFEDIAL